MQITFLNYEVIISTMIQLPLNFVPCQILKNLMDNIEDRTEVRGKYNQ